MPVPVALLSLANGTGTEVVPANRVQSMIRHRHKREMKQSVPKTGFGPGLARLHAKRCTLFAVREKACSFTI